MAEKREEWKDLDGTGLKPYHYMTDADIVNIEDKNNKINATNVESALEEIIDKIDVLKKDTESQLIKQGDLTTLKTTDKSNLVKAINELFTNANNGKQNWVDVIGSPLLTTDTFSTLKDKTQILKNTFASYLQSKKINITGTESLSNLINKIQYIDTGFKIAKGNVTPGVDGFEIRNLSFKPFFICGKSDYSIKFDPAFLFYLDYYDIRISSQRNNTYQGEESTYTSLYVNIYDDGFKINTLNYLFANQNVTWIAIGE